MAAAKVVAEFAKTNDKLVIRGGAFWKGPGRERREATRKHPFKEVLLANCWLDAIPHFPTWPVLAAVAEKRGDPAEAAA